MKKSILLLSFGLASACFAQDPAAKEPNNGLDPTRPPKMMSVNYEFTELRGGLRYDRVELFYQTPVTPDGKTVARFTVPFVSTNVAGRGGMNLGDIEAGFTNVYKVTKKYGIVFKGDLIFNSANHVEQGTGKNVLKGTVIYAMFQPDGSIFAPALVQSQSLWGENGRQDVRFTTVDFYYVPKLKDPKSFVTLDPNINNDWVNDKFFAGLAVTLGRTLGPAMGGTSQIYIKPSIFFGDERPSNWGIEIGYKVLGF